MTAKDTITSYFESLAHGNGWQSLLSDGMTFTSFTSPVKQLAGKESYLQATRRFYSTIRSVHVRDLIADGNKVCALTHYELQPPGGDPFTSDVAELFTVNGGRIDSLAIYFDTAPFPKPPEKQP